jgi:hypothetical protein
MICDGHFLGEITLGRASPVEPTHHSGAERLHAPVTTDRVFLPNRSPIPIEGAREITSIDERRQFDQQTSR